MAVGLDFITFADLYMKRDGETGADAAVNMERLNDGIRDNAGTGVIIGLPGDYTIAKSLAADFIRLQSNCHVICLPGCTIKRAFNSKPGGVVSAAPTVTNAKWIGGRFLGIATGDEQFPIGRVFDIDGSDIWLEDITIEGYNGIAMALHGDRITVINPYIHRPDRFSTDGAGIRVMGGTGFRCYDGLVESGDDSALQFSTTEDYAGIFDGAFTGTRCKSRDGRLLLVGTNSTEIRDVRFIGIVGDTDGDGEGIRVQNNVRVNGRAEAPISGVLFRDIVLRHGSDIGTGVTIRNDLMGPTGTVSDIAFDNLVLDYPAGIAFRTIVRPGANAIENVTWQGGHIARIGPDSPAFLLDSLNKARFDGIRIGGTTSAAMAIIGDTGTCTDVVFTDATMAGIGNGSLGGPVFGVRFDKAIACGWVRGVIAGQIYATAATMTANAQGCYVKSANLSAIGIPGEPTIVIDPAAIDCRIVDIFGNGQRTPIGMGAATSPILESFAIPAAASRATIALPPGSGDTGELRILNGGEDGDIITVSTRNESETIAVKDATGNLRLRADCSLNAGVDTLTLMRRGGEWIEVARSDNA